MRLVVCCDGTWNTPHQMDGGTPAPTNVYKFYTAVSEDDEQDRYYRSGVGTSGGFLRKLSGGALGYGIDDDIKSPYKWLCDRYDPDKKDEIFLIGFSRGAYTVRSLAGLISRFGLCAFKNGEMEESARWAQVSDVYAAYRQRKETVADEITRHADVPIKFLGVFDTVGALGIPPDLNFTRRLFNRKKYQFHDTVLGDKIEHAYHAVAMDERRLSFTPTLWTRLDDRPKVKQVWFPGVHGDVGGSYAESGLGDITLDWMIDGASKCGLNMQERFLDQLRPNDRGLLHDSLTGGFAYMRSQPRAVPDIMSDKKSVHRAARRRAAKPPISQSGYWPTTTIKKGVTIKRPIRAREKWSSTGIFLEAGKTYTLSASGEWLDRKRKCGPGGFHTPKTSVGLMLSAGIGRFKRAITAGGKDESSKAMLSRRQDQWPWFSLVGMIANGVREGREDVADERDPLPPTHQTFLIGAGPVTVTPEKSGYLYGYPNDAWHFYGNNRGKVWLRVELA